MRASASPPCEVASRLGGFGGLAWTHAAVVSDVVTSIVIGPRCSCLAELCSPGHAVPGAESHDAGYGRRGFALSRAQRRHVWGRLGSLLVTSGLELESLLELSNAVKVDVLFSMATLQVYDMAACGDQLRIMMEDTHERELDKSIRREPFSLAPRLCTTPFRQVYALPSPVPFLRLPHTTPSTHQRLSQVGFKPERPARPSGPIPTLAGLPTEIQEMILDLLDLLDGTCLGLVNRHFYKVHRRRHGSVPLSTARDGPNDLEWAWRAAGDLLRRPPGPGELTSQAAAEGGDEGSRSATRTRRRFWCEMCGFSRCELQRHLSGWVPPGREYCSVSRKFGPPAAGGMESHCHRRSPRHHGLCGRHHCKASSRVTIPRPSDCAGDVHREPTCEVAWLLDESFIDYSLGVDRAA